MEVRALLKSLLFYDICLSLSNFLLKWFFKLGSWLSLFKNLWLLVDRVSERFYIPYRPLYNPLLIRNCPWILTIHKAKGHSTLMNFKKWLKSIQTAGYNGAHTVLKKPSINWKGNVNIKDQFYFTKRFPSIFWIA